MSHSPKLVDEKIESSSAEVVQLEGGHHDARYYAQAGHAAEGFDLAPIDAVAEKKLVRKLDLMIMPILTAIYLCNFLDRSNVGNARAAGLVTELKMAPNLYNLSLTCYYLIYGAANLPSNLLLKRFGELYLAFMTIAFGVVTLGHAFIHNAGELIALRVLLGIFEGASLPGVAYTLSRFYTRKELVLRISIFLGGSAAAAGGFGGLLSSAFLSSADIGMVKTWRKIFLWEGVITMGIGIIAIFCLPAPPEKTRILNEEERTLLLARMEREQIGTDKLVDPISWNRIKRALTPMTIVCGIGYAFVNISVQGLSLFMPTIIATLGTFTTVEVQLRSVPPFILGGIWTVILAYFGSRYKKRGQLIMFSELFAIVGYAIFVGTTNSTARYVACFLGFAGVVPLGPIWLVWATDNAAPDTMRAMTTSIVPAIGTLGSIVATWSYVQQDAPNYRIGNSLNVATTSTTCVLALVCVLLIRRENAKRARGERDDRVEGKSAEEIKWIGWRHPRFVLQE